MNFFINKGVCSREETYELKFLQPDKLQLTVYNYIGKENDNVLEECIDFTFCGVKPEEKLRFYKGFTIKNAKVEQTGESDYQITSESNPTNVNELYALIRGTTPNDEIFIPSTMRANVEVIRRMQPVDKKQNYGTYLGNVYLIKVKLEDYECLPIFYAQSKTKVLMNHSVIYKTKKEGDYRVYEELKTYILLNDKNKEEYVALSKL